MVYYREKYSKEFKKIIKRANKMLQEDEGFKGKYFIRILYIDVWVFPDGSGGELTSFIRCYNKESKIMKDYRIEYAPWMSTFYWKFSYSILNSFIVNTCQDRADIRCQDWNKIKVPDEVFADKEYYFYEPKYIGAEDV